MLQILQERASDLGVKFQFESEVSCASDYAESYDLVVAADGLNSRTRDEFKSHFKPDLEFESRVFAEFMVLFSGNSKIGLFIRPMYLGGGALTQS